MVYSPWLTVASMEGVTVRFVELDGELGYWDPEDPRVINLDRRQLRRQLRCTLDHELLHMERGDECMSGVSPVLEARQEIAVATASARRLIPIERLLKALLWSKNEREIAEELNVDEETLQMRLMTLSQREHRLLDRRIREAEMQQLGEESA